MSKSGSIRDWLECISKEYSEKFLELYRSYFDKIRKYKEISNQCSIVFVLGISFKNKNNPNEKDKSGLLDKNFRLEATVKLLKKWSNTKFFIVAGYENKLGDWRTGLMKKWIEKKMISNRHKKNLKNLEELHCHPGNTCGNVKKIIEYLCEKKDLNNNRIGILTNFHQMPRFEALYEQMIKSAPDRWRRSLNKNKIKPIVAELVPGHNIQAIKKFFKGEEMEKRLFNEAQGTCQALVGCYRCNW